MPAVRKKGCFESLAPRPPTGPPLFCPDASPQSLTPNTSRLPGCQVSGALTAQAGCILEALDNHVAGRQGALGSSAGRRIPGQSA